MASKKKIASETELIESTKHSEVDLDSKDDFVQDLIKSLNKEHQQRIAYNLSSDTSPTHIKRWISTGSKQLDYIIANKRNGGAPEGRIIEIFGPPSIGKSHLAAQFAKNTQALGGIVVYIDTENAILPENLASLGVDVSKRFIYADPECIEDVFSIVESTITKATAVKKDIPFTIIWDSLAGTPPKAELEGDYDTSTMGLAARVISKCMRKVTQVIGNHNVLFVILNQTRSKIGVMYGDPTCVDPYTTKITIKYEENSKIAELLQNVKETK